MQLALLYMPKVHDDHAARRLTNGRRTGEPNIPNELIWGNANPKNQRCFGDPPEYSPTQGPTKFWPEQKAALNSITTTDQLYKAMYTPYYSTYQEVPVGTWDVGDSQPA